MSSIINDLFYDGIEVIIKKDDSKWAVDIKYNKDDGKYEDGEYLGGFAGVSSEDDAELLARAFIFGYKLGGK